MQPRHHEARTSEGLDAFELATARDVVLPGGLFTPFRCRTPSVRARLSR